MYDRDMPLIRAHALASPDGLADVITFTLLTIRQHLVLVPEAFQDVKKEGSASVRLVGAKREGFRYVQAHKHVLHAAIVAAVRVNDPVGAMDVLLNVPCLGLVKSAFVAQMCGLETGCLDTHNQNRLGLTENDVRFSKRSTMRTTTKRKHIVRYLERVASFGGARKLWNDWCAYVANPEAREAKFQTGLFASLRTASDVSRMHLIAMGLMPAYGGEGAANEIPF